MSTQDMNDRLEAAQASRKLTQAEELYKAARSRVERFEELVRRAGEAETPEEAMKNLGFLREEMANMARLMVTELV